MDALEALKEDVVQGRAPRVRKLVQAGLDEGLSVDRILNDGLVAAISKVGEQSKREEILLPEAHSSGRAMLAGMGI